MEAREAIEILHPDTVAEALAKYRRIGGYKEIKKATDEACLLACEALEKQVPKKPLYSDYDDNGDDEIIPYTAICPSCGHEFEFGYWNDEDNHHCICGQKMDWERGAAIMIIWYAKGRSCINKEAWYTCLKCGMCGRKFENGFLVNGEEFPPEDEWDDDEDYDDEEFDD